MDKINPLYASHLGNGPKFDNNDQPVPSEAINRQTIRTLEKKGRKAVEKKFNTLQSLQIEYVRIDSIFPNAYNPNRQSEREFDLLKTSIMEDGFTQPILVQASSREIIDGEHRWRAMKQLGFEDIPVVLTDMTREQARIATLRHNRARGSEDIELSTQILKDLEALGSLEKAMDSLGLKEKDILYLLETDNAPEALAGEEFNNAWIPTEIQPNATIPEKQLKKRDVSTSQAASKLTQDYEEVLKGATSLTQQGEISKKIGLEMDRITIVFKDASLINKVKEALGETPSMKLLNMACNYVAKNEHPRIKLKTWGEYYNYICDIVERESGHAIK